VTISAAYATAATYRDLVSKTDTSSDAAILLDLTAISRSIEGWLGGRFFGVDAAVVERLYDATPARLVTLDGMRALLTDEISTTTGLVLKVDEDADGSVADETAWTITTDFILWPRNAALGPEVRPYQAIAIPTGSSKLWVSGGLVSVTAKFGWPAVPSAIERACCHLTAILRLESPRATQRIPEGIDQAMAASPTAQNIIAALIDQYGRLEFS